mmetsp:Transcript_2470/g.3759  ORF Transcript_2470/g.3759 Transcript_2470/m.3759 type:complete len:85 (+) Transcript_2470:41-295(+)
MRKNGKAQSVPPASTKVFSKLNVKTVPMKKEKKTRSVPPASTKATKGFQKRLSFWKDKETCSKAHAVDVRTTFLHVICYRSCFK